MGNEEQEVPAVIFKDIRRYYCDFCGICRSKKSLITSHMLAIHEEEMKVKRGKEGEIGEKLNICEECGVSFRKPAYLKQHMFSHSLEIEMRFLSNVCAWSIGSQIRNSKMREAGLHLEWRSFTCPVKDCNSSYRRKDHLTRHMLQHEGKLFECPIEGCKIRFTVQGNMTRHVKEFHSVSTPANIKSPTEYICAEEGCGKAFKYLSKLRKHDNSHVKLDCVEALCTEPGCLKYFTNEKCLKEHILSCHQYTICDECGSKQLKKNMKRHLQMHDSSPSPKKLKCSIAGCSLTFSTRSNLNQHVKAVHMEVKPFACSISGCNTKFAFKHVRDKHEKSGCHLYTPGDFEESDEQFLSRPRGGRKRKYPSFIEILTRRRVVLPSESDLEMSNGSN